MFVYKQLQAYTPTIGEETKGNRQSGWTMDCGVD